MAGMRSAIGRIFASAYQRLVTSHIPWAHRYSCPSKFIFRLLTLENSISASRDIFEPPKSAHCFVSRTCFLLQDRVASFFSCARPIASCCINQLTPGCWRQSSALWRASQRASRVRRQQTPVPSRGGGGVEVRSAAQRPPCAALRAALHLWLSLSSLPSLPSMSQTQTRPSRLQ